MKYIILIGDGMAGRPLKELQDKTTLATAKTTAIDALLAKGKTGLVQNVPSGFAPGSDIASMSIFGYDPRKEYPGRAPLEAAAMGIKLKKDEVAFRCNLVTVKNEIMKDFTAGHIATAEAKKLIKKLDQKLGGKRVRFYPGVSYRHLAVIKDGPLEEQCMPPHDIIDKKIVSYLPRGEQSRLLNELMISSRHVLAGNKTGATQIWLWGQGQAPKLKTVTKKFKITGAVITAVDLLKGLGKYAGLEVIKVKGATGFIDTNYQGKVTAGLKALKKNDLLILHVEAPDECGHMGDIKLKIKAIENFDRKIVNPMINGLKRTKEAFRVLILPDHPTPIAIKTHSNEPVPFVFYDSTNELTNNLQKYCEQTAGSTGLFIKEGQQLLERLINGSF